MVAEEVDAAGVAVAVEVDVEVVSSRQRIHIQRLGDSLLTQATLEVTLRQSGTPGGEACCIGMFAYCRSFLGNQEAVLPTYNTAYATYGAGYQQPSSYQQYGSYPHGYDTY